MEIFDHGKSSFGSDYNTSTYQYVFYEGKSYKIIQQGMSTPDVKCRRIVTQSTTGSAASSTVTYEKIRKLLDNSIETLALSLNNK